MLKYLRQFHNENGGEGSDLGGAGGDGGLPATSGLPSDIAQNQPNLEAFKVTEEQFKDGKYNGRWNNLEEMNSYIKSLEDKHADINRKLKEGEQTTQKEIEETAETMKRQQMQKDTLMELTPQFLDNGMELNDEMIAKLKEAGLDEKDIKLGAYEYKEQFEKAFAVVGGKAEYDAMMNWAVQNLDVQAQKDFNNGLASAHSTFAIKGLYAEYKSAAANGGQTNDVDRVRGAITPQSSIKPYETKADLFRDKAYIDSPAGRNDAGAKARYKARLAVTPEAVWQ